MTKRTRLLLVMTLVCCMLAPFSSPFFGIVVFSLGGWLDRPCEIIGTEQLRSPDGKWDAIVRAEACGGAIGTLNEYVYLVPAWATTPPGPDQRVLEADPVINPRPIGLTWSGQDVLTLTLPTGLHITRREQARDGVSFLYRPEQISGAPGGQ
ncbi:MAG: hypothetical protein J0H14_01715 [Alphaproteobacteria bacterium]|nr:hypothetical protein [Alphaproteobacteria bacterium]